MPTQMGSGSGWSYGHYASLIYILNRKWENWMNNWSFGRGGNDICERRQHRQLMDLFSGNKNGVSPTYMHNCFVHFGFNEI